MSGSNESVALGVDPGYANCGIAVLEPADAFFQHRLQAGGLRGCRWRLQSHVWIRTDPSERFEARLRLVWSALTELCQKWRPVVVGFESQLGAQEGARRRGRTDARALQVREAVGIVRTAAWAVGAELVEVSPQAVKRALGAPGSAGKRQVVRAAQALFGVALSEHEADAAGAALVAARLQPLTARVQRTVTA